MNHIADANKMVGEDHIRDATKMVSDTPRTESEVNRQKCWSDDLITIDANFACQLERELNAANDRIKSLIEERDRANRLADWKWNLRDEFQLLLGTDKIQEGIEAVKEMKQRIKRLEEAGDALKKSRSCGCQNGDSVFYCITCISAWDAWLKAKEAKP